MKIFLVLIFLVNIGFCGHWSSSTKDGIKQAFQEYNNFVKQKNDKIVSKYKDLNKEEIEKILKNFKKKKDFLSSYKSLLKQELLEKNNWKAEIVRYKLLTDNEAKK